MQAEVFYAKQKRRIDGKTVGRVAIRSTESRHVHSNEITDKAKS